MLKIRKILTGWFTVSEVSADAILNVRLGEEHRTTVKFNWSYITCIWLWGRGSHRCTQCDSPCFSFLGFYLKRFYNRRDRLIYPCLWYFYVYLIRKFVQYRVNYLSSIVMELYLDIFLISLRYFLVPANQRWRFYLFNFLWIWPFSYLPSCLIPTN